MSKRRKFSLVAGVALAIVMAVGAASSALAFGPWGQTPPLAQAQEQENQNQQGWTCPGWGDDQTAQDMRDAMQSGDFDRTQDLMRERFGEGFQGMMPGVDAETMRGHMQGGDFERMQELMRNGDWEGMQEYMRERGLGDIRLMTPWGSMMGQDGFGGMMGPVQQPQTPEVQAAPRQSAPAGQSISPNSAFGPMMGGYQGGMMGGGMMGRR